MKYCARHVSIPVKLISSRGQEKRIVLCCIVFYRNTAVRTELPVLIVSDPSVVQSDSREEAIWRQQEAEATDGRKVRDGERGRSPLF